MRMELFTTVLGEGRGRKPVGPLAHTGTTGDLALMRLTRLLDAGQLEAVERALDEAVPYLRDSMPRELFTLGSREAVELELCKLSQGQGVPASRLLVRYIQYGCEHFAGEMPGNHHGALRTLALLGVGPDHIHPDDVAPLLVQSRIHELLNAVLVPPAPRTEATFMFGAGAGSSSPSGEARPWPARGALTGVETTLVVLTLTGKDKFLCAALGTERFARWEAVRTRTRLTRGWCQWVWDEALFTKSSEAPGSPSWAEDVRDALLDALISHDSADRNTHLCAEAGLRAERLSRMQFATWRGSTPGGAVSHP